MPLGHEFPALGRPSLVVRLASPIVVMHHFVAVPLPVAGRPPVPADWSAEEEEFLA